MSKGIHIFLTCLLGFAVAVGAFCIIYPIVSGSPAETVPDAADTTDTTVVQTQPDEDAAEADQTPAYNPEDSTSSAATQWQTMAQADILGMTLEEKVYQLFVVTPESLTGVNRATVAGETTRAALAAQPVGGIVYFAQNLVDREQAMELLAGTQSFAEIPLLLAVDEEGGTVSRVGANPAMGTTYFSDMADYGDAGDAQAVYQVGLTLGQQLTELGFNLDFAPVADVVTNPNNTEIGRRSFSSDPETAAAMVGSIVSGFRDGGILCSLKHFPGHGGTETDTHDGRAVTERTLEQMRQAEFLPFQAGIEAGVPMVMVGHLSAPNLNGGADTPSDLSYAVVTEILRGELGFSGVVVTDAQNMGAITDYYTPAEAAVGALQAGVDLILMPADLDEAVQGVLDALEAGTLSRERIDESVTRILAMKYEYGILQPE